MAEAPANIALLLDTTGVVTDVLANGLSLPVELGQAFVTLVHPGSAQKAARFLAAAAGGAATDWELTVAAGEALELVRFSATTSGPRVVVVGGRSRSDVVQLGEEMMRINNEQANLLRAALGELQQHRAAPHLYDELTTLNNELANTQRELAKRTATLERINKQKDQLLGMVAHDLRNPLAIISGYTKLMEGGVAGPVADRQRDLLERILKSTTFMLHLVEDLLDFSAIESGVVTLEKLQIDLAALLTEEVELARLAATPKRITVNLECPPGLQVHADERKLRQVVSNLLSNAAKFSWEDSTVRVSARVDGDALQVCVIDQGQGIPPEEQTKLFRPFGRTSVQGTQGEKSTGLGLAIVRRIVEAHGGRIWVESQPGHGATFRFTLPLK